MVETAAMDSKTPKSMQAETGPDQTTEFIAYGTNERQALPREMCDLFGIENSVDGGSVVEESDTQQSVNTIIIVSRKVVERVFSMN